MAVPQSCDTFVVLQPLTKNGAIFGKNSDRPNGEVQEVVYFPATNSIDPIKCTYIDVESSGSTKAVILSKPGWMWGAEMGANECGVAIGNEAIWTNDNDGEHDPEVKRLLGMDLVRLGLERSSSALEGLEVITQLLEKYGQGGPCSLTDPGLVYHNSFLIADCSSAWVLETSGKHWAAVEVTEGYKNISNVITITTTIHRMSDGLLEYAKAKGFWDGNGEFNFSEAFSGEKVPGSDRLVAGRRLLEEVNSGCFRQIDMFKILRDTESGICRPLSAAYPTQGSQVSVLSSAEPRVHWFTATPDPSKSVFKPFVFTPNAALSKYTKCPEERTNTPHNLYLLHTDAIEKGNTSVQNLLRKMEAECVGELDLMVPHGSRKLWELDELFKDCVETEVKFYR